MTIVTTKHLAELKYCSRGTRAFFVRHGMSWSKFVRDGLPADDFIKTGDAMAIKLAEYAREH